MMELYQSVRVIQEFKNKTEELEMEIVYFLFFISEESICIEAYI